VHRNTALLLLLATSNVALANEMTGTVCLGVNQAKSASEHTEQLYLTVNDSPNIYFARPFNGPRVVAQNLDINKNHTIKVYLNNALAQSWVLNFSNLGSNSVLIWRSAGAWRMEEMRSSSCK
jgi:hypothetical protein